MGRQPTIWWRESHGAFYTTIDGRQIRLGADRGEARQLFHRLMIGKTPDRSPRLRLAEITDLWLDSCEKRLAAASFATCKTYGQKWCKTLGRHVAADLKPYHVTAWMDGQATWSNNTRSLVLVTIRACLRWAVAEGYLERSPLDGMRAAGITRRAPASEEAVKRWLAACDEPALRDFATLALETGCRPGELTSLEARHVALEARHAIVVGKTGKRTVPLSVAAVGILARLAKNSPIGPILRSPAGKPWTRHTLAYWFARVSDRAGVKIVPYHLRGVFATRSLRVNGEILTAKILGHRSLTMLHNHYEGLNEDDLRAAVDRVSKKRV